MLGSRRGKCRERRGVGDLRLTARASQVVVRTDVATDDINRAAPGRVTRLDRSHLHPQVIDSRILGAGALSAVEEPRPH